mmetsp:Transcript_60463/g.179138  ORF Transcript_60463/g.179138 Transcript_60463/m.179138 type:complete len:123 (-) Transcript_60463:3319-3687(-)
MDFFGPWISSKMGLMELNRKGSSGGDSATGPNDADAFLLSCAILLCVGDPWTVFVPLIEKAGLGGGTSVAMILLALSHLDGNSLLRRSEKGSGGAKGWASGSRAFDSTVQNFDPVRILRRGG